MYDIYTPFSSWSQDLQHRVAESTIQIIAIENLSPILEEYRFRTVYITADYEFEKQLISELEMMVGLPTSKRSISPNDLRDELRKLTKDKEPTDIDYKKTLLRSKFNNIIYDGGFIGKSESERLKELETPLFSINPDEVVLNGNRYFNLPKLFGILFAIGVFGIFLKESCT